jgi:hypothetical protein
MNAVAAYMVAIHLDELRATADRERRVPRSVRPSPLRRLLSAASGALHARRAAADPATA